MSIALRPSQVARAAIEYYYEKSWTDGLPVVPCTQELLDEFLATTERGPDDELLYFKSVNRTCTVRDAAINAAMAGCLPEYFPVLLAAWRSVDLDQWASIGMLQSTSGCASMLVVNGPVRQQIGLNSAGNVFGSGFRANATIGRALRLTAINTFGLAPHVLDQATQGQPGRYSCCIAENEEASPWAGLHTDLGFDPSDSTVTALTMRAVSHIEARHTIDSDQLLADIANTIARTGVLLHQTTSVCVVLSPEHAHLLARQGLSKMAVRETLVSEASVDSATLMRTGKDGLSRRSRFRLPGQHPDAFDEQADVGHADLQVLGSLDAVHVVVAGAPNAGVSSVAHLFGPGDVAPQPVLVPDAH